MDYRTILAGDSGQRETFEELVCQIARRLPPAPDAEFRRIFGAGGDGGVEAVWKLPDGSEHGYQAKFYTESGRVDWSSMDNSVLTALKTHPKLSKMVVAIACTLTGPVAKKSARGRPLTSGWTRWDGHRAKWDEAAKANGRVVTFEPWTAPDIDELLNRAATQGLREYWFGAVDLSPRWMRKQFERSKAALEDRYQPDDHVDVSASDVFDGLRRTPALRGRLKSAYTSLLEAGNACHAPPLAPTNVAALFVGLNAVVGLIREAKSDLDLPVAVAFPLEKWQAFCERLRKLSSEVIESLGEERQRLSEAKSGPSKTSTQPSWAQLYEYALTSLRRLAASIDELLDTLSSRAQRADTLRFAVVIGRAGSGKSHLVASEVEKAITDGTPCVLLLGTDFVTAGSIEAQIVQRLELGITDFDVFLATMDAAAEFARTRGLIVIDAVNEAVGAALWRDRLKSFADRVITYPHLALCVSCRTEYERHVLTASAQAMAVKVIVRGFETEAEQEQAGRVYMDRRDIVRPATPWLSPEFVNPLFLRTTCLALEKDGRREFPRGLRGTQKVLRFFLNATARHLGTSYDGTDDLQSAVVDAILSLARRMAADRRDYVERAVAARLVDEAFDGFAVPVGVRWVELLRSKGLFRFDPHPELDSTDPLAIHPDIVRFSFQRFQDHLIVQALMGEVTSPADLFGGKNAFGFFIEEKSIAYDWRGAFDALWIQAADKFQVELLDCLPGDKVDWWHRWGIQDAFVESVRWRSTDAIGTAAKDLFNRLDRSTNNPARLIIELSLVESHPWNALFLHRALIARPLAERDSFWTTSVNEAAVEEGHPVNRLIDWSLNIGIKSALDGTLSLALLSLGWLLTSTGAQVRDRATKAICTILLERPVLFAPTMAAFRTCDDAYVVERLLAAAYGASCRDPSLDRLRMFSRVVYDEIFDIQEVMPALLLRDYARGIVDIAERFGAVDTSVDLAKCRPPHHSLRPQMSRKDTRLKARAKHLGAEEILRSCFDGLADFGRYTVEGRVESFAKALLSGPRPLTSRESMEQFRREVIVMCPERVAALQALVAARAAVRWHFDDTPFSHHSDPDDEAGVEAAEAALQALLNQSERARYKIEALPNIKSLHGWRIPGRRTSGPIDAEAAKRWIANRAISFGWTKDLFPHDRSHDDNRIRGARVERIGKKYQRMALSELLARLSDNYWLAPEYSEPSRRYDSPLDVSFTRDIDPTVLPSDLRHKSQSDLPAVPQLLIPEIETDRLREWVNEPGTAEAKFALATGEDIPGGRWVTLYRYATCDINFDERKTGLTPWKQTEFHFLYLLLMDVANRDRLISDAPKRAIDFHDWLPPHTTDGPFLGELGLRSTWASGGVEELRAGGPEARTYRAVRPAVCYQWESHLDGSLPNGVSLYVPAPWILELLVLKPAPGRLGVYIDNSGCPAIVAGATPKNSYLLIRRDKLDELEKAAALAPVWALLGERQAWPSQAKMDLGFAIRFNGLQWSHRGKLRTSVWPRRSGDGG